MTEVTVGSIFHWSWGYEQTNATFYEVVSVTPKTVFVRQIASEQVTGDGWAGHVKAVPGRFLRPDERPLRKTVKVYSDAPHLPVQYGSCRLWDGRPVYESSCR